MRSTSISRSESLPFHTDHPEVKIVGWRSEIEDPGGVGITLLGLTNLSEMIEFEDLKAMSQIKILYPVIGNYKENSGRKPLISLRDPIQIYYAPWLVPNELDADQQGRISLFQKLISRLAATDSLEIKMETSACLFIDNHRVLHGRRKIHPNSPRKMKRIWIRAME